MTVAYVKMIKTSAFVENEVVFQVVIIFKQNYKKD